MTNENESTPDLQVNVAPQYDTIDHWVVLTTNGAQPRVLKTEPRGLGSYEIALKLRMRVPRRIKRIAQTIVVTMPDELAHVAAIEVAVPQIVEEAGDE